MSEPNVQVGDNSMSKPEPIMVQVGDFQLRVMPLPSTAMTMWWATQIENAADKDRFRAFIEALRHSLILAGYAGDELKDAMDAIPIKGEGGAVMHQIMGAMFSRLE